MGPRDQGRQIKEGGETSHFLDLNVNVSKKVGDTSKLLLTTNRKSNMCFRLTPRSMTLDDLDLL